DARLAPAAELDVLQADGGDRIRRSLRRRRRSRAPRRGPRPRRRLAHVEDPALDLPRLPRPQGRERAGREGHRAAVRPVRDRPAQGGRPHDRPEPARRDPPGARARDGRPESQLRGAHGDLRRARAGCQAAPAPRLPGDRHLRALDRGDGPPRPARARGAEDGGMKNEKGSVPLRYWLLWWALLAVADFTFYVLLTPIWIGLRALAWVAEFRSRRRR